MPFDNPVGFVQPIAPQSAAKAPLLWSQHPAVNAPTSSPIIDVTSYNSFVLGAADNQDNVFSPSIPGSVFVELVWYADSAGTTVIHDTILELNSHDQIGCGYAYIQGPMYGPFMQVFTIAGNPVAGENPAADVLGLWGSPITLTKITGYEQASNGNTGYGSDGKLCSFVGNIAPGGSQVVPVKLGPGPAHLSLDYGTTNASTSARLILRTNFNDTSLPGNSNTIFTLITSNAGLAYWGPFDIIMPKRACNLLVQNLDSTAGHTWSGTVQIVSNPE